MDAQKSAQVSNICKFFLVAMSRLVKEAEGCCPGVKDRLITSHCINAAQLQGPSAGREQRTAL
jgi:hypothetical protein